MHAMIASSSISPYMWIARPKMSNDPLWGEGIEASRLTRRDILPWRDEACALQENLHGDFDWATLVHEVDREVEIDVVALGDSSGIARSVAGALELLGAPLLDPVELGVGCDMDVSRRHAL